MSLSVLALAHFVKLLCFQPDEAIVFIPIKPAIGRSVLLSEGILIDHDNSEEELLTFGNHDLPLPFDSISRSL